MRNTPKGRGETILCKDLMGEEDMRDYKGAPEHYWVMCVLMHEVVSSYLCSLEESLLESVMQQTPCPPNNLTTLKELGMGAALVSHRHTSKQKYRHTKRESVSYQNHHGGRLKPEGS